MTTTTLYTYVNGDGSLKAVGQHLLDTAKAGESRAARSGSAQHAQSE